MTNDFTEGSCTKPVNTPEEAKELQARLAPDKTVEAVARAVEPNAWFIYDQTITPSLHAKEKQRSLDRAARYIKAHSECLDKVSYEGWFIHPDHKRPRLQIPDVALPEFVDVRLPFTDHLFVYAPEPHLITARARVAEMSDLLRVIDHLTFEEFDIGDWRTRLRAMLLAQEKST